MSLLIVKIIVIAELCFLMAGTGLVCFFIYDDFVTYWRMHKQGDFREWGHTGLKS